MSYEHRVTAAVTMYEAARNAALEGRRDEARTRYLKAYDLYRQAFTAAVGRSARIATALGALAAARELMPTQFPRWAPQHLVCNPDGKCSSVPDTTEPRTPSPDEARFIEALRLYFRELPTNPHEYLRVLNEAADLHLLLHQYDEAWLVLRRVIEQEIDLVASLKAAWMFLAAYSVAAKPGGSQTLQILDQIVHHPAWSSNLADASAVRWREPDVRVAAARACRVEECKQPELGCHCSALILDAADRNNREEPDAPVLMLEAARWARHKGDPQNAIGLLSELVRKYPDVPHALEARFVLAETYESILDLEAARDRYHDFLRISPRDERRAAAFARWVRLAYVTGRLTRESAAGLGIDRAAERSLDTAVRFRELRGADLTAIQAFLRDAGASAGNHRLGLAHALAGKALLRASCPAGGEGLCVEIAAGDLLGKSLPRDPSALERARGHLERAQHFLALPDERARGLGPPLDLEPEEVDRVRLDLAFIRGDLNAESALAKRPPASYEPTRTREWLARRMGEVERMAVAYDAVMTSTGVGRDAPRAASRKARVYEADALLLDQVARAMAAQNDEQKLAEMLRGLAADRRRQASEAYKGCIRALAAWGHDSEGLGEACRAGLGRISRRYEAPLEYTAVHLAPVPPPTR